MKVVKGAALLVIDKVAAGRARYGERMRSEVSIDHICRTPRRHRRVDLGLQSLHLLIGLLKFQRGLLQLLIGTLQLLRGGLDP